MTFGSSGSPRSTIASVLSGTVTSTTPPEKDYAASQAAWSFSVVSRTSG